MQLSYKLLTYMSRLGDEDATAALNEWNRKESDAKKADLPLPHLEAHYSPPDLFFVHAPIMPQTTHTNPGMPAFKARSPTLPGIPLPGNYPINMIQIIDADGGTDGDD
jgi:hypothetical protein